MSQFGKPVVYNGGAGKEKQLAFIISGSDDEANLVVLGANGVEHHNGVPRRDPSDYGAEGGGHTWHPAG